jgi:hypothetical protein
MQKTNILILLAVLFTLSGCREKKISKLIKKEMAETLSNYESYEILETDIFRSPMPPSDASEEIELAREYIRLKEAYENGRMSPVPLVMHEQKAIKRLTEIDNSTDLFPPPSINKYEGCYMVTQKIKCRNRYGVDSLYVYKYIINATADFMYNKYREEINPEKDIEKTIKYLLSKYNYLNN